MEHSSGNSAQRRKEGAGMTLGAGLAGQGKEPASLWKGRLE